MKRYLFLLVVTGLVFAVAACSSGGSEPEAPEPVSFTIEMTEYAYTPNEITVAVGQEVTLTLVNKGQLEHEIMLGRDVVMEDGRPNGYTVDLFEFAGVEPEVHGGMLMIDGEMVMQADNHDEMAEGMDDEMEMAEGDADHDEEMDDMAMDEHDDEMAMGEDGHLHGHDGLMVMVPQGDEIATMTFLVTEEMVGTWEIGCFQLEGVHYDAGMTGTLTVTDS